MPPNSPELTVPLHGRVALVTGAANGMGLSHARVLHANGARVVLADLDGERAQARAAELGPNALGSNALGLRHDVTSAQSWRETIEATREHFGDISVLVNNAGIVRHGPMTELTEADYRAVVEINQHGTFLGMTSVVDSMRRAGSGSIVNVASTAGLVGFANILGYVASKWAIRGMSKAAAIELAQYGIRVNTICPGVVDTPMTAGMDGPGASLLRRRAQPEEISALMLYLASDASAYCTGADFVIDGGETATGPAAPL